MRGNIAEDLRGRRFGLLTVIEKSDKRPNNDGWAHWECKCDCGKTTVVASGNLKSGNTRSCGCLKKGKKR